MISMGRIREAAGKPSRHVVDRWFARKVSIYITWLLLHTPISANQVTLLSLAVMLGGLACIAAGTAALLAVGVALLLLAYILDCCDGEVARYRNQTSLRGEYLDALVHATTIPAMFLAAGTGLMLRTGKPDALWLGAAAAIAAMNPAKAALAAVRDATGRRNAAANGAGEPAGSDTAQPPVPRAKRVYLSTLGRLLIFPNSMFVLCAAALADAMLAGSGRGALYYTVAFYALLLTMEQALAAVSWSREQRLAQEVRR